MNTRCAIYARFSSDRQSPASIDDQIRKCQEFAERSGYEVRQNHVYRDVAISGAGMDRPGLVALLTEAAQTPRRIDIILLDDTSRLSRSLADAVRTIERLNFLGTRVIAVSQGIDSQSEQADVLLTVHNLVDSLYIKELAKKTHRGLEGRVLRGLHAGGRCFGYRSTPSAEGMRLAVVETEAATVVRIFELYADGLSLKAVTKRLNSEAIPPPRGRSGETPRSWCHTAIREMLRRDLYRGLLIWNRAKFVKVPGTNRRVSRPRPEGKWKQVARPELRIVGEELWVRVQQRLKTVKDLYGRTNPGLLNRAASSPYLLSGFLCCGMCGAKLVIVTGRGKNGHPRFGCPQNFYRGSCSNRPKERRDLIENRLLAGLQASVLHPQAIDYAVQVFVRELQRRLTGQAGEARRISDRRAVLVGEIQRLTAAIAEAGHSPVLLAALVEREQELHRLEDKLREGEANRQELDPSGIRGFVSKGLMDVRTLLNGDVPKARAELARHLSDVRLDTRRKGWPALLPGGRNLGPFREHSARFKGARSDGCGGWI